MKGARWGTGSNSDDWGNDMVKAEAKMDFAGAPVVRNPPTNSGDAGSIPGLERSHMLQLLEPTHPRALTLQQGKPLQCIACPLQLEKACVQQ